jgi:hypothetical protein
MQSQLEGFCSLQDPEIRDDVAGKTPPLSNTYR